MIKDRESEEHRSGSVRLTSESKTGRHLLETVHEGGVSELALDAYILVGGRVEPTGQKGFDIKARTIVAGNEGLLVNLLDNAMKVCPEFANIVARMCQKQVLEGIGVVSDDLFEENEDG